MPKAQIAHHPIHSMLIVFPLGLWIFSWIADLVVLAGGAPVWNDLAFYTMLGGLIGAAAAAVPGFMDYFTLAEPRIKKVAFSHMVLNLAIVALYAFNLYLRADVAAAGGWPVALSGLAMVLLGVSGWLGGELVYVHGVGVKPPAPANKPSPETRNHEPRLRRVT